VAQKLHISPLEVVWWRDCD